ncbi:hypothetical protein BB559_000435 [Furculomyces boomerangus]|uniref:Uncharacterized protein n=1 Tax=Furculomyces boomerangus TaxID=61424 RepID=A0A2T9Z5D0_9FUNG|nr:hypothetical protein BB559_000435 [Furculomyces boomerangus]
MLGKTKSVLGLLSLFTISSVYSAEHNINGIITRNPGFEKDKVHVVFIIDGESVVNKLYRLRKLDSSCTGDCTFEILYDTDKSFRFNSGGVEFEYDRQIYNIGYSSTGLVYNRCTRIEGCDNFLLRFETNFSSLDIL